MTNIKKLTLNLNYHNYQINSNKLKLTQLNQPDQQITTLNRSTQLLYNGLSKLKF